MEQVVKQERRNEQRTSGGIADEPSARQKAYIQALARAAGLKMDVSTIGDKAKATRIIDSLKLLNKRMNGDAFDVRDRRVAFGLSTKLVFASYAGRERCCGQSWTSLRRSGCERPFLRRMQRTRRERQKAKGSKDAMKLTKKCLRLRSGR